MDERKYIFRQTGLLLLGQAVCIAAMNGIFALLGYWDTKVLLGSAVGGLVALANFFVMALVADLAADKAEKQDVKGGQTLIQLSYMGRLIGLFLVLVLCAKTEVFNLLALVLPLIFNRPILSVADHFTNKKGGANT